MLLTWGTPNKHWFRMIKNFPNSPLNGLYTFAFLLSRHGSFFFTGAPEYIVRLMHFNLHFFYHKGNRTFLNMFKLICLSFLMNYLFIFLSTSFHQFWGVVTFNFRLLRALFYISEAKIVCVMYRAVVIPKYSVVSWLCLILLLLSLKIHHHKYALYISHTFFFRNKRLEVNPVLITVE